MALDQTAILWDVDGAPVDSEPPHEAALIQALADLGLTPPADFRQHIIGRNAWGVHKWCHQHLSLELDLRDWLHRKYRTYLARAATPTPRSGAVDLFQRTPMEGHVQAIVSNSDRMVVNADLDQIAATIRESQTR